MLSTAGSKYWFSSSGSNGSSVILATFCNAMGTFDLILRLRFQLKLLVLRGKLVIEENQVMLHKIILISRNSYRRWEVQQEVEVSLEFIDHPRVEEERSEAATTQGSKTTLQQFPHNATGIVIYIAAFSHQPSDGQIFLRHFLHRLVEVLETLSSAQIIWWMYRDDQE